MAKKIVLFMSAFIFCVCANAEQTSSKAVYSSSQSDSTNVDATASNLKNKAYQEALTQAKRWDIDVEDWKRYKELNQGLAKYDFAHVDPVHVLGIFARNDEERQKFARIFAQHEYIRVQGLLDFDRAYMIEARNLIKERNLHLIDDEVFYRRRPDLKAEQDLYDAVLNPGDRLVLFVKKDCPECSDLYNIVYHRRKEANVALDIYFVGIVSDDDIRTWARRTGVKPDDVMGGKVTLNHDRGEAKRFGAEEIPSVFVRGADK